MSKTLVLRPIILREANAFVAKHHSHRGPTRGNKFSIGCFDGDRLCGVVIVGRPVARRLDNGTTLEVTRCCTDRTPHAASKLIAAAARASFAMGVTRMVSYIREDEEGTSYRAAGWVAVLEGAGGESWDVPSYRRTEPMAELLGLPNRHLPGKKTRWEKAA